MAKFGLFGSGDTTNAVQVEYEGDHIRYMGTDIVVVFQDSPENRSAAIIRLGQGQSVKKIDG